MSCAGPWRAGGWFSPNPETRLCTPEVRAPPYLSAPHPQGRAGGLASRRCTSFLSTFCVTGPGLSAKAALVGAQSGRQTVPAMSEKLDNEVKWRRGQKWG